MGFFQRALMLSHEKVSKATFMRMGCMVIKKYYGGIKGRVGGKLKRKECGKTHM